MKKLKIVLMSVLYLAWLSGCATAVSGSHLIVPNKPMQKIDPSTINTSADAYRLSPRDVLLIKIETLEAAGESSKIDKGNQLQISFTIDNRASYKISAGDQLTLEFPDEVEGLYEVLVTPDGRITLPKLGKNIPAAGLTLSELNKKTVGAYQSVFVTPKISWALTRSFGNELAAMSRNYSVGSEGDVVVPNIGMINVLGKTAPQVAQQLTEKTRQKFKNKITADVSVAKVNEREQVDNRLTPGGLVMFINPNNLPTPVAEDGTIYISGAGDMVAQGKTIAELKQEIAKKIQPNYQNPVLVSVVMQDYADYTVYIGGEVRQPGRYPYTKKLSMLKLIAQAGWGNEYADLGSALLLRADGENSYVIYRTNLDEILQGKGPGSQDLKITPQDLIIVPPTGIAKANRYIAQYIRGILPFGTSVTYNINDSSSFNQ